MVVLVWSWLVSSCGVVKCLGSITGYIIHFMLQHSCHKNILLLRIGAGCEVEKFVIFLYSRFLEAQERKKRERERDQEKIKENVRPVDKYKK